MLWSDRDGGIDDCDLEGESDDWRVVVLGNARVKPCLGFFAVKQHTLIQIIVD